MEQAVLYNQVALSHLVLRKGNLQQVVFSFVRIVGGTVVLQVGQTVGDARQAVRHFQTLQRSQTVGNLLILLSRHAHHRLVHALPVVHVLALAPLALEGLLTLRHGLLVVEVPLPVIGRRRCGARRRFHRITLCTALLQLTFHLSLLRFFALILFLLLQGFDDAVDGCVTVLLVHLRQLLQRVLQMDGVGIGHELVEHLRALRQLLVVGTVLVQHAYGSTIAALGVVVFLERPVEVAQTQQQHAALDTRAGGFLVAFLVGADGFRRVFLCQVDVADGVVHLIQIVLVVIVGRHTLQLADHASRIALSHHLGLGNAGVEGQLVGRILTDGAGVGFVGGIAMAQCRLHLSHDEPQARFLRLARLALDDLTQVGHGLLQLTRLQVVVGVGGIPVAHRAVVYGVATHVAYDVLGIVEPVQLRVALSQPGTCQRVLHGLCLIQAAHVGKSGSRLVEGAFLELRLTHHHPSFPQERVILLASQPLAVLGRLASALLPLGAGLDGVQLDGFLHLLDGTVVVALARLAALLVAHGIEGQLLRVVVLVALLLLQVSVDEGQATVIVGVVFGSKRLPEATLRRILMRRAPRHQDDDGHHI